MGRQAGLKTQEGCRGQAGRQGCMAGRHAKPRLQARGRSAVQDCEGKENAGGGKLQLCWGLMNLNKKYRKQNK